MFNVLFLLACPMTHLWLGLRHFIAILAQYHNVMHTHAQGSVVYRNTDLWSDGQ